MNGWFWLSSCVVENEDRRVVDATKELGRCASKLQCSEKLYEVDCEADFTLPTHSLWNRVNKQTALTSTRSMDTMDQLATEELGVC